MKKLAVDLNADVGESFGPYKLGNDEALFSVITSANIACGFHAGDPATMSRTLNLAAKNNIAVGAHPGYPDRLHFGRLALPYSVEETTDFVLYQIGALQIMAEAAGLVLQHVKLHGALYHVAAEDRRLAEKLLDALVLLQRSLILVGPPDSVLQKECEERGFDYAVEGFADRSYSEDGKLVPRNRPNSLITEPRAAAEQAVRLVKERSVKTILGAIVDMKIDTICVHGDTPGAPEIAAIVRQELEQSGIIIEPLSKIMTRE